MTLLYRQLLIDDFMHRLAKSSSEVLFSENGSEDWCFISEKSDNNMLED